jgi:N-acetylglutamate synthase-like GNAT family acetyltransferase
MLSASMNEPEPGLPPNYQIRRATVDDLPQLKALWTAERLPAAELDKRFTEFQLAVDGEGKIAGAVGLRIYKLQGLIHSEAFARLDEVQELRPLLWERLITVAKNHGLARIWMMPTVSFYREQGMSEVEDAIRAKLPEDFGHPKADWISLRLKEENASVISLEKEFEIFAQAQKAESEEVIKRAQVFRALAYTLLAVVLLGLGALALIAMRRARSKR